MGRMVGIPIKDGDQQLHLLGRLNLEKNFFSAIVLWGHSYKQCLSQGGIDWRILNRAEVSPSADKGPDPEKEQ